MSTYKDDLDILKAAEKDANRLSLNAITELDNKGMLGMYGGGGSEGDNPVKLADVKFVGFDADTLGRIYLNNIFSTYKKGIPVYYPEHTEVDGVYPDDTDVMAFNQTLRIWNQSEFDNGMRLIAPFANTLMDTSTYIVSGVQGEAEILSYDDNRYIRITGDCTIIISANASPK